MGALFQANDRNFYGTSSYGGRDIGTTGVFLNGIPASFTVVSDTFIQATVPAGANGGYVTVQTPSGTLTSNTISRVEP